MKKVFLAAAAASLFVAYAADAQSNSSVQIEGNTYINKPGDIRASQLENVAIRVAKLTVDNDVVKMHVGDTLSLSDVVVTAYDSAGAVIGRLRQFDSTLRPSQFVAASAQRQYVALAEGSAEMILQYPRAAWFTRTDAPLIVHLRLDVVP